MSNNSLINHHFDLSELLMSNIEDEYTFNQLLFNGADLNFQTARGWCVLFEAVTSNYMTKSVII